MDFMVPWVTLSLVLLLLIGLPLSCAATESVTCTGPSSQTYYDVDISYASCIPSSGLRWAGDNRLIVIAKLPVEIEFRIQMLYYTDMIGGGQVLKLSDTRYVPSERYDCPEDKDKGDRIEWSTDGDERLLFGNTTLEVKQSSILVEPTGCFRIMNVEIEPNRKSAKVPKGVAVGLSVAAGVVAMILVVVVVVMRRRLPWHKLSPDNSRTSKDSEFSSVNDLSDLEVGAPRLYTYKELSGATQNFSSKYVVGEGGFGTVYKGVLKDSPYPVAIKRLSQYARQGAREFVAEVKIISQLRHRNLVQLLGWCLEKDELILVYEYMTNGDLDELIYADKPKCDLCWKQRFNVLCGVTTALVYLHEEWVQRVVHRDVKTSNVMLDSNLNARLGDFGLARLSAHSQAPQSTLVAGTLGYLAPEFSMSGKATDKTDVYAFGVVALEVTCGRRPLSPDLILVDWVWDLHKQDRLLDAVDPRLDRKLRSSDDELQMTIVLQLGLLCAHPDPNARPTMRQVLNMLKGEASVPRVPRSKPVASYFEDD